MQDKKIIVYKPNKYIEKSFFFSLSSMVIELIKSFPLGWRLFLRDFSAKYKQQFLGVLWVFIVPIITVFTYALLGNSNVLNIDNVNAPYPVYAFLGVTVWGLIQGVMVSVSSTVNQAGELLKRISFPKDSLIISPVLITLIDFFLKIFLFLFICWFYKYRISFFSGVYLFYIIPALLFGLGVGLLLSIIGAVLKDVSFAITYLSQLLLL